MTQCGYDVALATNGGEAIEMLSQEDFALVVIDLMMPGIDGYELVETIDAIPLEARPPVIVVTGCTLDEVQTQRIRENVKSIQLKSGLSPRNLATHISEVLDGQYCHYRLIA